jgi:hypothetical protein
MLRILLVSYINPKIFLHSMPSVNIYTKKECVSLLNSVLPDLRKYIANVLSCGDRSLAPAEVSLRVIVPEASLQIAEIEVEMRAFSYSTRVMNQDTICRHLKTICPNIGSTYVWLQLSELGHSAEE